jgi:hypothetical protein
MKSIAIRRNGWREPFADRAHEAAGDLRRQWRWPVGAGLAITLPCLIGLGIYSYQLDQPWNPGMVVFSVVAGAVVFMLLTMDAFIPRVIRFREDGVFLFHPGQRDRFLYADLRRCELTAGPDPVFRGLGESSRVLFEIYWHPALDPEVIQGLLAGHNIPFLVERAQTLRGGEGRP